MASSKSDSWSLVEVSMPKRQGRMLIRKNLVPRVKPGSRAYPWVAYMTFRFRASRPGGMPGRGTYDALETIENDEIGALDASRKVVFVGAVLKPSIKDHILYLREPNALDRVARRLAKQYPKLKISVEVGPDPSWGHWAELP